MAAKIEPQSLYATLTLEEFAALERIGIADSRDLARRNALPFPVLRLGREYRISRRAYEAWRDGGLVGTIQPVEDREPPRLILRLWAPSLLSVWLGATPDAVDGERIWVIGVLAAVSFVLSRRVV